jgi:hypothetical protein
MRARPVRRWKGVCQSVTVKGAARERGGVMHHSRGLRSAAPAPTGASRRHRLVALAALGALALVASVGSATASGPLKVCATCTYTDIAAALAAAAAQSGDETIQIEAGSYPPSAFTVSTNVTLIGAGAGLTTIGGVNVDAGVSVTIKGVTITNVSGGPGDDRGVRNAGALTLKNCVVSGNQADSAAGILNLSTGTVTLQDSAVTGNSAFLGSGGGIFNAGAMTLQNSTVSENGTFGSGGGILNIGSLLLQGSAVSNNGAFSAGGGIYNLGTVTLRDSAVSDNVAVSDGGGGIGNGAAGTTTMRNSIVSGNRALFGGSPADGGGISNFGTLSLADSTVSGNHANDRGGGIYNGATGTGTLTKSTVSANTAAIGPGIYNDGGTITLTDSTVQA